ncbi:hypothetical protein VTP01DRAFT_9930 [Rhizomucor pusillus]|uniref:uncharacterized protein n=1 Tax=Rhizomucor pusillus TaxID=4840 RepID=UPI003741F6E9
MLGCCVHNTCSWQLEKHAIFREEMEGMLSPPFTNYSKLWKNGFVDPPTTQRIQREKILLQHLRLELSSALDAYMPCCSSQLLELTIFCLKLIN